MENKVNEIKSLIKEKNDMYPNLSNLWIKYIEQQINQLNKTLDNAEKVFNNINQDLSMEFIVLLFLLSNKNL